MGTEQEGPKAAEGAAAGGDAQGGSSQPGATVNYEQAYKELQRKHEAVARERDALKGQGDLRAKVEELTELVKVAVLSGVNPGAIPDGTDEDVTPGAAKSRQPSPGEKAYAEYQARQAQSDTSRRTVTFAQTELKERVEDAGFSLDDVPAYSTIVAQLEAEVTANPSVAPAAYEKAKKALSAELRKKREEGKVGSRVGAEGTETDIKGPSGAPSGQRTFTAEGIARMTLAEYAARKAEIDAAARAGKITK